jgi:ParB/RepB/Spo0J family partition protein
MITAPGEHRHIPLHQLQASPFNRKRFDAAKMAELTQNVGLQGIIVPIVARPLPSGDGFEIVAGERRYRAAKAAGLVDIPAIVRELTDAQALELQVIENGQREDVHPLEEAEGYERSEVRESDGTKYTADDIALKVGKSRSYVFNRLKLTRCARRRARRSSRTRSTPRRAPHRANRPSRHAAPGAEGHHRRPLRPDKPMSYREAHQHILQTYMLKLSAAPFDIKDAGLNRRLAPAAHARSAPGIRPNSSAT